MRIKEILTKGILTLSIFASSFTFAQGTSCADMDPICTDEGISFTAGVGAVSEPGNDYGCLFTQPNPSWYYLEISVPGDLEMELYAGSDIDFIIWGPFDDLADAQSNCGTLGDPVESPEVDCSYSGVAYETPEIPDAEVGEVYILLITNYAAVVQDVTLNKIGGEAETDCGIVDPPCSPYTGTFVLSKNGDVLPSDDPINLCQGDEFTIISNGDYELPPDTIPAPIGDGIYTAQLMWLIYTGEPVGDDPFADPNYTGIIIPNEDIADIHDADSPIIDELGCGTYYFVPVSGDDGVGDGGDNDNFSVTWDKDGNGCYDLGDAIIVNYACPIEYTPEVNCGGDFVNGMDFTLSGGFGDYTLVNIGAGELAEDVVENGGTATVFNLSNGSYYEFDVIDAEGCETTISGIFAAPVINPIVITPALSCPDASVGNVDVTIIDGSGNGGPYGLVLNGTATPGTNADVDGPAGEAVVIIAVDGEGCITDTVVTITSAGHYIETDIVSTTNVTCFGFNDGTAEIEANPVNEFGVTDGVVTDIIWTAPSGASFPGDETNTSRTGMMPGTWLVTVIDEYGCEVTIPVEITSPAELNVFVNTLNEPTCYGFSDGSIDLSVSGGTPSFDFSWKDYPDVTTDVLNTIGAGSYWGYVTDGNGCIDSVNVIIGEPDSLYAEFTVKNVLCFGDSSGAIIIDEVFNSAGTVRYFWDLGGAVPTPPTSSNVASGLPVGTYIVIVQDEYCDKQYEITITQNPAITLPEFEYAPAYCRTKGFQNGNGQVSVSATGGVADYSYLWTDLQTGETKINSTWGGLNPGLYQIEVTDDVGCIKLDTIQVDSLNPIADFTVTSDQFYSTLEGTETVFANFKNNSSNFANPLNPLADTTFRWNFNHDNIDWILSEDVNEEFDTIYTGEREYEVCLIAFNKNDCRDTLCKTIIVHAEPDFANVNVFTPNGDGANDVFTFEFTSQAVEMFKCVIVDRWGNVMFEFDEITDTWDGRTPGGRLCTDGVYFYNYEIVYTNGTEFAGQSTVTIANGKE
jgi:gliding motility-associated-like protein